jgi:hypothetical protein
VLGRFVEMIPRRCPFRVFPEVCLSVWLLVDLSSDSFRPTNIGFAAIPPMYLESYISVGLVAGV